MAMLSNERLCSSQSRKLAGDSGKPAGRERRLRRRVPQPHQAIGFRERQRPQHHGVHHREHRGVDADAETKNDDGREREAGLLEQPADAVTEVASQRLDQRDAAPVAVGLLGLLDAAKRDQRLGAAPRWPSCRRGGCRRCAAADGCRVPRRTRAHCANVRKVAATRTAQARRCFSMRPPCCAGIVRISDRWAQGNAS